ncbi:MAG: 4Fe-4S binding protein [Calditrichaeota bacterium]|nr:4Fe-4S binding protein [Calditrichota bacterium]
MPCVNIEKNRCKGCELCVTACPQQIIRMSTEINVKGYFYAEVFDQPRCIGCTLCGLTCPDLAITVGVNAVVYRFFDSPITIGGAS